MNEYQKIKKDLTFCYNVFIVLFVVFCVVQSVIGWNIMTDVRAFNQCGHVEDAHFKECYDNARQ